MVVASGVGSLAVIVRELHKAPEGYEDEHGFHIVIASHAVGNAIGYAQHRSRSHRAVIRVYDGAGN